MSQFGGKMSKFQGKFDIVSTDLRNILSNFVATDVGRSGGSSLGYPMQGSPGLGLCIGRTSALFRWWRPPPGAGKGEVEPGEAGAGG